MTKRIATKTQNRRDWMISPRRCSWHSKYATIIPITHITSLHPEAHIIKATTYILSQEVESAFVVQIVDLF